MHARKFQNRQKAECHFCKRMQGVQFFILDMLKEIENRRISSPHGTAKQIA